MLLRELKEVLTLREWSDDQHTFASAVQKLKGDAITSTGGGGKDNDSDDVSGRPPTADVDAMLRPIIQIAVDTIDPSTAMLQSKVNQSLNTPELKKKGTAELSTSIQMVNYLRFQFIRDFSDLDIAPRLMRLPGGAGDVAKFVEKHSTQAPTQDTIDDINKVIARKKTVLVDVVMKRGAADKFHQETMANFSQNAKDVEVANPKALQGLLVKAIVYVAFLKAMETNLTTVKKMIGPDRDDDKADASA